MSGCTFRMERWSGSSFLCRRNMPTLWWGGYAPIARRGSLRTRWRLLRRCSSLSGRNCLDCPQGCGRALQASQDAHLRRQTECRWLSQQSTVAKSLVSLLSFSLSSPFSFQSIFPFPFCESFCGNYFLLVLRTFLMFSTP